jgi:hypothetical protein
MNRLLASAFFASILTASLHANIVTNGSFETLPTPNSPSLIPGDATSLPGWTVIVGELAQISPVNPFGITASDLDSSLDLTGYHDSFAYGGVEQILTTTPGATYSIQFDVASFYGTSSVQVSVGDLLDIGSTTTNSGLAWTTYSGSFTASDVTSTLDLVGTLSGSGNYIGLDNVVVNYQSGPSVPEPASWLLLAGGVAILGLVRRKTQAL